MNVIDWNIREVNWMKLPDGAAVQCWSNPNEFYEFFKEAGTFVVDKDSNVYMSTTDGFFHVLEGKNV